MPSGYRVIIKNITSLLKRILPKYKIEIFLFFYFILIFIFYSWTTLTNSQSFLHVDDREIWVVSHNIYKNHSLTFEEPLHEYFDNKVFYTLDYALIGNKVVPRRSFGIYFLTAFGFLFGENGPFYLISILGLACSIFLYLFIKNLFDKKIALLSTVLFSSSFPIINWSNMLFNNIPAFSFYIIGLFFFSEVPVKKRNKLIFYLLATIFFSLSIWFRYEYILFVLLLIVWILKDRKYINFKYLIISIIVLIIILLPILLLNNYLYKSPFLIGYNIKTYERIKKKITDNEESSLNTIARIIEGLVFTFKTFSQKLSRVNINIILHNYKNFIFYLFPQILPFALFGLIYALKSENKNIASFTIYSIFILIFWMFYIMRGYNFGGKESIAGASNIRYLFLTYLCMILFSTYMSFKLFNRLHKRLIYFITILIIIVSILNTINLSFFGKLGVVETHKRKEYLNNIDNAVKSLPSNSIIINDIFTFSIGIRSRKVLDMRMIYRPSAITDIDSLSPKTNVTEVVDNTIKYIKILLDLNYPVYILEKNYFNLLEKIEEKEEILDTKKVISGDYFELHKVFYKEK